MTDPGFVVESERLLLRRLVPTDLEALDALYRDPEVSRFIPDSPTTLAETREELEWHEHGHPKFPELGLWATIEKATQRFIGRCGLLPWTIDDRHEVEIAYLLARDRWGQGLGAEAAAAIRDHGFTTLGLERLIALVIPENAASIGVARDDRHAPRTGGRRNRRGQHPDAHLRHDAAGPFLTFGRFEAVCGR